MTYQNQPDNFKQTTQVCMPSNAHFESWDQRYGLDFRAIAWDAQASLQSVHGQGMIAGRLLDTLRYLTQETPSRH
jgi:hypothetical protein